tara:strand:- start:127 stop:402 length:276 start_codon:yes stop_codon:yes gene_type:complete
VIVLAIREMPSPAYILRGLFTAAELTAMLKELFQFGRFTSLAGGAKNSGIEYMPFEQQVIEIRAELDRLNGTTRPNRVEQVIMPDNGYNVQ